MRREDDRDGGIAEHPLDEQLGCATAAKLRGDRRQGVTGCAVDHRALGERAVHQHGDAELACERQEARARLRLGERIVDLQEIGFLAPDHALEFGVGARDVMRNADVAHRARVARGPERREVRAEILQVVHLHEVEGLRAQEAVGVGELARARLAACRPDLGCEERRRGGLDRGQDVADAFFGAVRTSASCRSTRPPGFDKATHGRDRAAS